MDAIPHITTALSSREADLIHARRALIVGTFRCRYGPASGAQAIKEPLPGSRLLFQADPIPDAQFPGYLQALKEAYGLVEHVAEQGMLLESLRATAHAMPERFIDLYTIDRCCTIILN